MTTHHLLHHFAPITEAPAAVARLRQLVLDLAVAGKFGTNHLTEAVPEKYQHEPCSENLPSNWRLLRFDKYFDIQGGNQPPKGQFIYEPKPGYVRLFQIRDLGEDPVPTFIPINSTNRFCKVGEILIGRYGASIGKIFWAKDGAYNVALAKFIFPMEDLDSRFAFLLLKSYFFQNKLTGASRSAQAGFNKGDIAYVQLPLPPLAEQQRIVAKVDELMTLCDELAAAQSEREARRDRLVAATLHRLAASADPAPFPDRARFYCTHLPRLITRPEHIHQLRQTILTLAVQGKLVPQDPHDEPASELLKQVIEAKKRSRSSLTLVGEKQLLPLNSFEEMPFELPSGWVGCVLDTILLKIEAGRSFAAQAKAADKNEKGVLKVSAVTWGKFLPNENKALFSSEKIGGDFSVRAGDVLITRANTSELVGAVVLVEEDHPNLLLSDKTLRLIFASDVIFRPFILYALRSPWVRNYFAENATGTSHSMRNLSQEKIRMAPIALPPLAEQQRIVARVDELLALCDELAANLDTVTATRRRLLEAALQEALVAA